MSNPITREDAEVIARLGGVPVDKVMFIAKLVAQKVGRKRKHFLDAVGTNNAKASVEIERVDG